MKISKKHLFLIGTAALALIVGGGVTFFLLSSKQEGLRFAPVEQVGVSSVPTKLIEVKTWTDSENGISFSYPANFSVDKFFDKASVAGWMLTSREVTGSIILKIQEPANAYSLKEWLPLYKEASKAASVTGVTIAGEKGSQYVFVSPSSLRVTAIFHDGVLYLFEGGSDNGGVLDKAYDSLLSSFSFLPEPTGGPASAPASAGEGNVEYEGEEVVE